MSDSSPQGLFCYDARYDLDTTGTCQGHEFYTEKGKYRYIFKYPYITTNLSREEKNTSIVT